MTPPRRAIGVTRAPLHDTADDIALLKTYGLGPYAETIKAVEKDLKDISKKVRLPTRVCEQALDACCFGQRSVSARCFRSSSREILGFAYEAGRLSSFPLTSEAMRARLVPLVSRRSVSLLEMRAGAVQLRPRVPVGCTGTPLERDCVSECKCACARR